MKKGDTEISLEHLNIVLHMYQSVIFLCLLRKATVLLYTCQMLFLAPELGLGLQLM